MSAVEDDGEMSVIDDTEGTTKFAHPRGPWVSVVPGTGTVGKEEFRRNEGVKTLQKLDYSRKVAWKDPVRIEVMMGRRRLRVQNLKEKRI